MIPKEMKYNLHYGDEQGDALPPSHGTNTSCSLVKQASKRLPLETRTHYGLENGSLGFIELFISRNGASNTAYTLYRIDEQLHFQLYHKRPNDPKGNEI